MIYNNDRIPENYTSVQDLLAALTHLAQYGGYIFRGYSKQDQLLPSIIRDSDYSDVESDLLDEFERYASHYFIASTPIDFLSYAQHYGLPTRLLDFTYNPFIALSFALFSQKGTRYAETEDKDFYYIRYCRLCDNIHLKGIPADNLFSFGGFELDSISKKCTNSLYYFSKCLGNVHDDLFEDYLKGLYDCDYQKQSSDIEYKESIIQKVALKKLCFIDPSQSNQRIIMQQGLFMLPYSLSPKVHRDLIQTHTSVIKIQRDMRDNLLEYLDTLGYNTFRLMPDLSSICAAVTQKIKDERMRKSSLFKKTIKQ